MIVTDEILNEWSFRCHDGVVDLNDPKKLRILKEILDENGIDLLSEVEINEIDKIINTLQGVGIRKEALSSVRNILAQYDDAKFANFKNKFRTFSLDQVDEIYREFNDFFNIKTTGLGVGEVMLIMGLKDSKSGGTAAKDIELKDKTYEVKELSNGEFKLGSDGYITNTDYLANLTSLKKYLNENVVSLLNINDSEKETLNRTIRYYTENGPNNASRGFINDLEKSCEILNKSIAGATTEKINYISVDGKKVAVSDEDYDKIKAGSGPVTISFGNELTDAKVSLYKLDKHPWVNDPKLVKDNLNTIWIKFLDKLDGMVFYNYPGNPSGVFMGKEEINNNFIPFRINLNSLTAKEKSSIKKEITENEEYGTI